MTTKTKPVISNDAGWDCALAREKSPEDQGQDQGKRQLRGQLLVEGISPSGRNDNGGERDNFLLRGFLSRLRQGEQFSAKAGS